MGDGANTEQLTNPAVAREVSPTKRVTVKQYEITDSPKNPEEQRREYVVTYVRTHDDSDAVRTSQAQEMLPSLVALSKSGFPDIDETNIEDKFAGCNGIDLVVDKETGEAAGYHVYKFRRLSGDPPVTVMYTSFAVVGEKFKGNGLTRESRSPVIEEENPDIIAGSTNVPAIHISNERIADERGMVMYPRNGEEVPHAIVDLARETLAATLKAPPKFGDPPLVDDNLVRTRRQPKPDEGPIKYFANKKMPIGPHQQVLYMMIKPDLHERVLTSVVRPRMQQSPPPAAPKS